MEFENSLNLEESEELPEIRPKEILAMFLVPLGAFFVAVVHTTLAAGNWKLFFVVAAFTPSYACALGLAYKIKEDYRKNESRRKVRMEVVFWAAMFYFMLPIILNVFSVVLSLAGYETVGLYFYEPRYWSWLLIIVIVTVFVLTSVIMEQISPDSCGKPSEET